MLENLKKEAFRHSVFYETTIVPKLDKLRSEPLDDVIYAIVSSVKHPEKILEKMSHLPKTDAKRVCLTMDYELRPMYHAFLAAGENDDFDGYIQELAVECKQHLQDTKDSKDIIIGVYTSLYWPGGTSAEELKTHYRWCWVFDILMGHKQLPFNYEVVGSILPDGPISEDIMDVIHHVYGPCGDIKRLKDVEYFRRFKPFVELTLTKSIVVVLKREETYYVCTLVLRQGKQVYWTLKLVVCIPAKSCDWDEEDTPYALRRNIYSSSFAKALIHRERAKKIPLDIVYLIHSFI